MKLLKEDILFSLFIRERDRWTCQRCGCVYPPNSRGLENSHFYTRSCWSVRFDCENCDALCTGCHYYFEGHPHEFREWKMKRLGAFKYWALVRRANTNLKDQYGISKKELRKQILGKMKELGIDKLL